MIIVTGGAGFIGANIVHGLNRAGETNILVVDNLTKGDKFLNLRDLLYADYMDKVEFRHALEAGRFDETKITAIYHQGACSDTMEYDGRYMLDNNFTYSKVLLQFALRYRIPFVYASSAATYGDSTTFKEVPENENPLNVYGYSKLLFDQYAQRHFRQAKSTIAGLRYFNVYGPREVHKGRMASMVYQLYHQLAGDGVCHLFEGTGGYENGGQRRDFVSVADVVDVNLFLARGEPRQGIFNVGTGKSRSFNAIARAIIKEIGRGEIRYKPMPEVLAEKYQNFTEADIGALRAAGYDTPFTELEEGVAALIRTLAGDT
ncbi:MAG: ADP-glyceromanno-heptose 6-epimerase [Magnetococcales bacterium]|nr:ADP-glyceromanno-heptose 6-epimerase [Magnetococcales bacterium]